MVAIEVKAGDITTLENGAKWTSAVGAELQILKAGTKVVLEKQVPETGWWARVQKTNKQFFVFNKYIGQNSRIPEDYFKGDGNGVNLGNAMHHNGWSAIDELAIVERNLEETIAIETNKVIKAELQKALAIISQSLKGVHHAMDLMTDGIF